MKLYSLNGLKTPGSILIALLISSALFTPAALDAATTAQKPVAKVNETVLTERDLEEALNEIIPAGSFHGGFSPEKRNSYRPMATEKMIEKEIFYQEALIQGLKADETKIKKDRDHVINRLGGEENFKTALKNDGLTDEKYQNKLRKKYLIEEFTDREVNNKARVSDREVKAYYEKNKTRFMRPEARKVTHILLRVNPAASAEEKNQKRIKAQEVIDRIKSGGDMAMLAWDFSEGPYRVKGGDLGLIHKGRLDPGLEKEVFKLKAGQLSDIIETRFGYHIVRVEEVKAPEQLSLEQSFKKISKNLKEEKEKKLMQDLKKSLKAKARIEIY